MLSRLEPGQTLEARILEGLSGGRWSIRLLGQNLVAESRLPMAPGQLVRAHVQSLGPPVVLTLTGLVGSEADSISRALQDLALAGDAVNRAVVRGLIGQGLPVSRDGVMSLRELLVALGPGLDLQDALSLEQIAARALMLQSRGLPVTPDTLQAYLSALPAGALGSLLDGLIGILRSLRHPGFDRARTDTLAQRIQSAAGSLQSLSADGLKNLLSDLGVDLEGRLAAWLLAGRDGLPEGAADTLRGTLLKLQQHLNGLDPDTLNAEGRGRLEALLGQLREALQCLDTQQAINIPCDGRGALQLQIPLLLDGRLITADLALSPAAQGGGRQMDEDSFDLSLSIDLSGIGPLRIHLSCFNRRLSCSIYCSDDRRTDFIRGMAGQARAALESCGYTIAGIYCNSFPKAESTEPPSIGLDLRV